MYICTLFAFLFIYFLQLIKLFSRHWCQNNKDLLYLLLKGHYIEYIVLYNPQRCKNFHPQLCSAGERKRAIILTWQNESLLYKRELRRVCAQKRARARGWEKFVSKLSSHLAAAECHDRDRGISISRDHSLSLSYTCYPAQAAKGLRPH